eukprot:gene9413-biopygen10188
MVLPWYYHGTTMVLPWYYGSPRPRRKKGGGGRAARQAVRAAGSRGGHSWSRTACGHPGPPEDGSRSAGELPSGGRGSAFLASSRAPWGLGRDRRRASCSRAPPPLRGVCKNCSTSLLDAGRHNRAMPVQGRALPGPTHPSLPLQSGSNSISRGPAPSENGAASCSRLRARAAAAASRVLEPGGHLGKPPQHPLRGTRADLCREKGGEPGPRSCPPPDRLGACNGSRARTTPFTLPAGLARREPRRTDPRDAGRSTADASSSPTDPRRGCEKEPAAASHERPPGTRRTMPKTRVERAAPAALEWASRARGEGLSVLLRGVDLLLERPLARVRWGVTTESAPSPARSQRNPFGRDLKPARRGQRGVVVQARVREGPPCRQPAAAGRRMRGGGDPADGRLIRPPGCGYNSPLGYIRNPTQFVQKRRRAPRAGRGKGGAATLLRSCFVAAEWRQE